MRLSFKPDSSFFRKIAAGAIGARLVAQDLNSRGHDFVELERGSTDTKLWKDVKRKRVRIPDLICKSCGRRVESRAKAKPEFTMSHSPTELSRAWDFGLLNEDWIAFPVIRPAAEQYWSSGRLDQNISAWAEENTIEWIQDGHINYVGVQSFRATPHHKQSAKGVTEGSEISISWPASFCTFDGAVEALTSERITLIRSASSRRQSWRIREELVAAVKVGAAVAQGQLIVSSVASLTGADLACPGGLTHSNIKELFSSAERTVRFGAIKLARLLSIMELADNAKAMYNDAAEDLYTRLEAACFLASVGGGDPMPLYEQLISSNDEQTQLESIISLGECRTLQAEELLASVLHDSHKPFFLRAAAAWALGHSGGDVAQASLIAALADLDVEIRQDSLSSLIHIGRNVAAHLMAAVSHDDGDIAAGSAEALRQIGLSAEIESELITMLSLSQPPLWSVWLAANHHTDPIKATIADLQATAPHLHYAVSLWWTFLDSWIARRWKAVGGLAE